jgi:hypothetical protein
MFDATKLRADNRDMKHHRPNAYRIIALACLLGAAHPAMAADTGLTLVEHATTDAVSVHGGSKADNIGDMLTFANPMFDAADKVPLGTDQGFCVRLVLGKSYECHILVTLAKGQISVDGPFYDTEDSVMAVTGGTGVYRGVRGEMLLHARDAKGTAFNFTYTLDK